MAPVATVAGEKLLVQLGDAASPETFAHDCMINAARGIVFSSDVQEFIVPDCSSPENPAWKERTVDGLSAEVSGAGIMHVTTLPTWTAWLTGSSSKNLRVNVNTGGTGDGSGYWEGAFLLTGFEVTGERKGKIMFSATMVSDGVVTWVPAA